jgi:hypothetical protein
VQQRTRRMERFAKHRHMMRRCSSGSFCSHCVTLCFVLACGGVTERERDDSSHQHNHAAALPHHRRTIFVSSS